MILPKLDVYSLPIDALSEHAAPVSVGAVAKETAILHVQETRRPVFKWIDFFFWNPNVIGTPTLKVQTSAIPSVVPIYSQIGEIEVCAVRVDSPPVEASVGYPVAPMDAESIDDQWNGLEVNDADNVSRPWR